MTNKGTKQVRHTRRSKKGIVFYAGKGLAKKGMKTNKPYTVKKPCKRLGYCPYGVLIEQSPLKLRKDKESCKIFGHQCFAFKVAEDVTEGEA